MQILRKTIYMTVYIYIQKVYTFSHLIWFLENTEVKHLEKLEYMNLLFKNQQSLFKNNSRLTTLC